MTEKRFTIVDKQFISYYGGCGYQISDGECKFWLWHNEKESQKVCDRLNALHDENEQLKQAYAQLKHRHSLLHDECIDAECDRDSYHKDVASLEKENEQLKKFKEQNIQEYNKLKKQCNDCKLENEQLKQQIKDYNKALKTLQDVYERKDRQLQRAKKDTRKYTDYFMNELNWDCDRIIEEVFR